MSTAENHEPRPASLETVLRDAWDAFHPGQPAPLGWLTHTTDRIHDHLRTQQQSAPTAPPAAIDERSAALRRQVWQTLRDAAAEDDIAPDAADRILHALDLPGLLRSWRVRLVVPVTIDVVAASRDDAVEAAEDAIDAALSGSDHHTYADWGNDAREDATPGDIDTTGTPADLR